MLCQVGAGFIRLAQGMGAPKIGMVQVPHLAGHQRQGILILGEGAQGQIHFVQMPAHEPGDHPGSAAGIAGNRGVPAVIFARLQERIPRFQGFVVQQEVPRRPVVLAGPTFHGRGLDFRGARKDGHDQPGGKSGREGGGESGRERGRETRGDSGRGHASQRGLHRASRRSSKKAEGNKTRNRHRISSERSERSFAM
jgi:hypothetical protein